MCRLLIEKWQKGRQTDRQTDKHMDWKTYLNITVWDINPTKKELKAKNDQGKSYKDRTNRMTKKQTKKQTKKLLKLRYISSPTGVLAS